MFKLGFFIGVICGVFVMCVIELVCYLIDYLKMKIEKEKGVKND